MPIYGRLEILSANPETGRVVATKTSPTISISDIIDSKPCAECKLANFKTMRIISGNDFVSEEVVFECSKMKESPKSAECI